MTDIEELADLLVLQQRILLEVADLIPRLGRCSFQSAALIEYEQFLGAAQKSSDSSERLLQIYLSLLPYLRKSVTVLEKDAENLRRMLLASEQGLSEVCLPNPAGRPVSEESGGRR